MSSPKIPRHKNIPYRLYGNTVSAARQADKEPEGKSGAVPLPGVPPGGSPYLIVDDKLGNISACIGKTDKQNGQNQAQTEQFLFVV